MHRSLGSDRELSVGVDARALHSTGVGRYIREVLAYLFLDARFRGIVLLGDPEELTAFAAEHGAAQRVVIYPYLRSWSGRRAQLSWLALSVRGYTRADVWFFPFSEAPLLMHPRRSVVTFHDLIPLKVPEMYRARARMAARMFLHASVGYARRVIANSEFTRRDILEHIPGAASKVEVIPMGVSPAFRPLAPGESAGCAPLAALRPFLLCVGNRLLHKNYIAAVDALALLRAEGSAIRLVVAGGRNNVYWPEVVRHAETLGVGDALLDLGEVTDSELRCLYGHCVALLFPSLYEGFGIPILEAMACGAPVIASNRSSLPEVVGDAGFLVGPHDPASMAAAVRRLEREPELRADLSRRGRERAAHFSWESTARSTVDVLYRTATA
jgi:glycosyltransferase involved in cell wall biosynthesis